MNEFRGGACAHARHVATGRHVVNALRMNVGGGLDGMGRLLPLLLLLVVIERPCGVLAGVVLLLLVVVGLPCFLGLVLMVIWLSLAIIVVRLLPGAVMALLGLEWRDCWDVK